MRSVKSLAILTTIFTAAVAQADPLFFESFENGNGDWYAADGGDVTIASDADSCSTNYDHETVPFSGGRLLGTSFAVTGGSEYCVSAFVRAAVGSTAYLGYGYDANDGSSGGDWLMGDGYAAINADGGWHWYAAGVTAPVAAEMYLMLELGSGTSADFDDITVTAGPCAAAYAGADQHQTCSGDAPVCSADGSCQPATTPGDMGGGSSSSPDMGGVAPGNHTTIVPTQSSGVAAEGTPSNSGPVTAVGGGGGCSMTGSQNERSCGVFLFAFVAVMIAAVRRRRRA
jgi:hypothetical protein